MSRNCTVCLHPEFEEINRALIAGTSIRDIANQFALNPSSVDRHKKNHLPAVLVKAEAAKREACSDDLFAEINRLRSKAEYIAEQAEEDGDYRTALAGIRELVRIIELMAKLRGELQAQASINITLSPQWINMRTIILRSLEQYPEARIKLAEVLANVA